MRMRLLPSVVVRVLPWKARLWHEVGTHVMPRDGKPNLSRARRPVPRLAHHAHEHRTGGKCRRVLDHPRNDVWNAQTRRRDTAKMEEGIGCDEGAGGSHD